MHSGSPLLESVVNPFIYLVLPEHLSLHTSSPVGRLKLGASNEQNGPSHPGACKSAKGDEYILCH